MNICTRYIFQMVFRENIGYFTDLHNEKKINLEVTCKRNRLGYWNLCKRLPNFVNVADLIVGHFQETVGKSRKARKKEGK